MLFSGYHHHTKCSWKGMMWEELWGIFPCGHACQCGMVWVSWLEALRISSFTVFCKLHIQYHIYIYLFIWIERSTNATIALFGSQVSMLNRGERYISLKRCGFDWWLCLNQWFMWSICLDFSTLAWIDCHLNTLKGQTLREKYYWLCCSFNLFMVLLGTLKIYCS